ncbi:NlpC/P60 family protein [Streptomyces turgidiscabies]|uniref:NlpC/P60 family protein n=1 Tax=Streptomyces turgidiscabies (strain Car8) TaxID=698760 RepID=L7EVA9_STRT8|nr:MULTISPECIES: C40 family peptidase [Streptomyces]ELP62330.1 NlpC/P60 family protein [Streptomyces turgidiscabies Car8]MDX3499130.1 NlpC/P60 family protein [Streptomyces turgidiscabies]GAQ75556.1 putative endopeptidase precursor [Streptomyces turgidiscabies]
MASSHRKSRPTGTRVAGIRTPAFATAALTASVALLTQTANAAPTEPTTPPAPSADDKPSVEEVEAEVDDLYHKAESAADVYNAAKERAARQQGRVDTLMDDVARRTQKLNDAREELGSFAAAQYRTGSVAPDTATFLLADDPQDYFDQNQLMDRMTARQKDTVDEYITQQAETTRKRQEAAASLDALTESQDELQTTKTAVQTKLVEARRLLSRLTAEEKLRLAAIEREKQADARRQAEELARQQQAAEQQRQQDAAAAAQQSPGTASSDTPTPAVPDSSYAGKAEKALAFARAQVGKPYVWGATGPDSYDCSSLTQAAWRAAGVSLPRTTYDQVNAGTTVPLSDIQPGDLVFFYEGISHVGLYIGNGMMIHAPKPGAYVREESIFYDGESAIHSVVRPA